jgi:hypothetical protein
LVSLVLVLVALAAAGAIGWGAALLLGTLAQTPPAVQWHVGAAAHAHAAPLSQVRYPGARSAR